MKIRLRKTDKRHTGHDRYQFYVDIKYDHWSENSHSSQLMFYKLRVWCWETWGPSREVDQWNISSNVIIPPELDPNDKNPHWSWVNNQYRYRIYLAGTNEAALFKLKWS